jgi:hypothetical protein
MTRPHAYRPGIPVLFLLLIMLLMMMAPVHADPGQSRTALHLCDDDRQHLLGHMREFLEISNGILASALEGDHERIATLAEDFRPTSTMLKRMKLLAQAYEEEGRPHRTNQRELRRFERMAANLSPDFVGMYRAMRLGFDDIAEQSRQGAPSQEIMHRLVNVQNVCIACHRQFEFVPMECR